MNNKQNFSQSGQDLFVSYLINNSEQRYFLDIGCYMPFDLNNTIYLENIGWNGLSIDILDLKNEWKKRKTNFKSVDALKINYDEIMNEYNFPQIIDYLSLDIEGLGFRFEALKKVFESKRQFKVITIEHDSYRGQEFVEKEAIPQRSFLKEKGFVLVCEDVCNSKNPFEDWWINPKYITEYEKFICKKTSWNNIISKI